MVALRWAIGSDCAATAVIPIAIAETASTVRIIEWLPSLWAGGFRLSGQPRIQFDIPQKKPPGRAGRGSRSRELKGACRGKDLRICAALPQSFGRMRGRHRPAPGGCARDPAAHHGDARREDL